MINIDRTDKLYKYLSSLKVDNIDEVYLELAQNGRFKLDDVRAYFSETFRPSQTEDIDEKELEKVLDYYIDLKQVKNLNSKALKEKLAKFKQTKDNNLKNEIINSKLKDILYLCLNYSTLHKREDIQDLIQEANFGLIKAIERYDENANIDFKDYLIYYVRESINFNEEKTNG